MLTEINLKGIGLKGFFQRASELVAESQARTEDIRTNHPEFYERRLHFEEVVDGKHEFEVVIFDFNPNSGFLLGKGIDRFGDSGLVGQIGRDGSIQFNKIYAGKVSPGVERFGNILYIGRIDMPDNIITCGGTYQPVGISENYAGIWRLDSQL